MFATKRLVPLFTLVLAALCLVTAPSLAEEFLLTIPQPGPGDYNQYFGSSCAAVGDQNGDGFDDFVVGQPGYWLNGQGSTYGQFHFFLGGPQVSPTPALSVVGPSWDSRLGWSVTQLGDFNGDGHPDFAASMPGGAEPAVRLYWGGPGLDAVADMILPAPPGNSWFGGKLSGGRDLNGDGWPDVAVAAQLDTSGGGNGRVYVYFGGPSADVFPDLVLDSSMEEDHFCIDVDLVGDVTGDGLVDLLVLSYGPQLIHIYAGGSSPSTEPFLTIPVVGSSQPLYLTRPGNASPQVAAGDIDGDGKAEIVTTIPFATIRGGFWVYDAGPDLDTTADLMVDGRREGEYLGTMLEISGDYDGDGVEDLLLGSVGYGDNDLTGYLWLYSHDPAAGLNLRLVLTDNDHFSYDGHGIRRFARSAASLGDLDGDGQDELLVGSASPYGYAWVVDEVYFDRNDDGIDDLTQEYPGLRSGRHPGPGSGLPVAQRGLQRGRHRGFLPDLPVPGAGLRPERGHRFLRDRPEALARL
jgi:hypothetical protein